MKVGKMMEIIVGKTAGFCYGVKELLKVQKMKLITQKNKFVV